MSAGDKRKKSSFVFLYIAIGFAVGGVLMVPLFSWLPITHAPTFETNGQIGDFVGGILNPIIALLALMWLKKGVELQQQELSETKATLQASEKHQAKQVKIAAITALLVDVNDEIERFKKYKQHHHKKHEDSKKERDSFMKYQFQPRAYDLIQKKLELDQIVFNNKNDLKMITDTLEEKSSERGRYIDELKALIQ